jgi:hypothetical protein
MNCRVGLAGRMESSKNAVGQTNLVDVQPRNDGCKRRAVTGSGDIFVAVLRSAKRHFSSIPFMPDNPSFHALTASQKKRLLDIARRFR